MPPNSRWAAWRASSGDMPLRRFSSVRRAMCDWSSVSSSASRRVLPKMPSSLENKVRRSDISGLLCARKQLGNYRRHALPAFGFSSELFFAGACQRVVAGAAIVFRSAPLGRNPAALFEAQECGVERALIQLEKVFGNLLDALGDTVTVKRPERIERFENDEVKRALKNFAAWRSHIYSFR